MLTIIIDKAVSYFGTAIVTFNKNIIFKKLFVGIILYSGVSGFNLAGLGYNIEI